MRNNRFCTGRTTGLRGNCFFCVMLLCCLTLSASLFLPKAEAAKSFMDNGLDSPKAKTKVQPQGYKFTLETKAWNTVAEHLLQQAPDAQEPELLRIVADALREGAQSPAAYNNVKTAVPFLAKANAQVQTLAMKMPTEQTLLHNETLSIAACLIVMIRENTLIDKLEPRPAQAALLRYFHQSGHWQSNDGSVTSVYYYEIIPKMAEQQAK